MPRAFGGFTEAQVEQMRDLAENMNRGANFLAKHFGTAVATVRQVALEAGISLPTEFRRGRVKVPPAAPPSEVDLIVLRARRQGHIVFRKSTRTGKAADNDTFIVNNHRELDFAGLRAFVEGWGSHRSAA